MEKTSQQRQRQGKIQNNRMNKSTRMGRRDTVEAMGINGEWQQGQRVCVHPPQPAQGPRTLIQIGAEQQQRWPAGGGCVTAGRSDSRR